MSGETWWKYRTTGHSPAEPRSGDRTDAAPARHAPVDPTSSRSIAGTALATGHRLDQLQAVSEGVVRVAALVAFERLVVDDLGARRLERPAPAAQVAHEERRMRLARRPEILFDADVDLEAFAAEPTPPELRQVLRLRHLRPPEQAGVERPDGILLPRRHRNLHVMNPDE